MNSQYKQKSPVLYGDSAIPSQILSLFQDSITIARVSCPALQALIQPDLALEQALKEEHMLVGIGILELGSSRAPVEVLTIVTFLYLSDGLILRLTHVPLQTLFLLFETAQKGKEFGRN